MRAVLPAHGKDGHRCNGPDPIPVLIHLPMPAATRRYVVTGDCGGSFLRSVEATVSTAGSSTTTVSVVKDPDGAADAMQTIDTTIDASETTSYTAATPHEMDTSGTPPVNSVALGDVLEVTATMGSGADDLTVLLEFGPRVIRVTPP